ncbi:uncharacterized protein ColSpa_11878 [Colletotrichum spaethianum]|uniref:Uncharacterized protein n=1 Tax=Colletotrichum spaethianum TaxID=700344 RepID=A0AA37PGA8_9PEZI|nr:uncharacterized protein ColSpa_11878 [Colletotrichum spaethianum]GKT51697.1 hypothetical protein ColSpa_11878 [Colletotrichum spaethianum]
MAPDLNDDQDLPQVDETADGLPNDVNTVYGAHCPMPVPAHGPNPTAPSNAIHQEKTKTHKKPPKTCKMVEASGLDPDGNELTDTEDYIDLPSLSHSWQLNQIKCCAQTVGTSLRQSWRWVPDIGSPHFKHQLLAGADKSPTGIIYDPNNFQVDLAHIESIWWAEETLKVDIVFQDSGEPREDLLLEFRCKNNRDLFLGFCRAQAIYLYRTDAWVSCPCTDT